MTTGNSKRVLAIGLDGYEVTFGDELMKAGELPALARLRERSACFTLDHGPAQRTGLAWEHVATGLSPDDAKRWSAVGFDLDTYEVWQEGTSLEPFTARLRAPAVVFDPPYFDLDRAPSTRGVVAWGAHDPGVELNARPTSLHKELASRFGPYPADEWIYGIVWPSAEHARTMGDALVRATDVRAGAARWLLAEREPDWRLALVVTGELHSAIEGLWHGVDPTHPLHTMPSARPAGEGLRAVYRAVDRLVGNLMEAFPDATVVAFAMGGMGPNRSDVGSMVLLPELLYRYAFGKPLLEVAPEWAHTPNGALPMLRENDNWSDEVVGRIPRSKQHTNGGGRAALRRFVGNVRRALDRSPSKRPERQPIPWMPGAHYQPYWPEMRFFAMPSFYDGRIRINLAGRERHGKVAPGDYAAVCAEAEELVRACRDSVTGEPVVDYVERCGGADPQRLDPSAADLVFVWKSGAVAFDHPVLGRIGPVPLRRSGGHTGRFGVAYVAGDGIAPGDFGVRSSFDVVPTFFDLLGEAPPAGLSGSSLFARRAI
jgi:predicted AlkP superfamily phosphohydrolase/phosphomutase